MKQETKKSKKKKVEKSKGINFKHWLSRTILIGVSGIVVFLLFDYLFHFDILNQSLILLFVSIMLGLLHELLHVVVAVYLKYKLAWFRTRFTMGFEIEHPSIRGERTPEKQKIVDDIKKIGRTPYYVVVPISCFLFAFGYFMSSWGLEVAGALSIIFHTLMYSREGISE